MSRKLTISHCHAAANRINAVCLSTVYTGVGALYEWSCNTCGTTWRASLNNVRNNASGCPRCNDVKLNISDCHTAASRINSVFLSTIYTKSNFKYDWQCLNCGNTWSAKLYSIRNDGQGCPRCAQRAHASKPEAQLRAAVTAQFPDTRGNIRGLLANKRYELDIFVPSANAAIEFDGYYWHSLPRTQAKDSHKEQLCKEAGIALLRVQEKNYRANPEQQTRLALKFLEMQVESVRKNYV